MGQSDFENLQIMHISLDAAIHILEQEELTTDLVLYSLNNVDILSVVANIPGDYRRTVIEGYWNPPRFTNDLEFREEVIARLKAYHSALGDFLYNAEEYKESHLVSKIGDALSNPLGIMKIINGKLYYNYVTQESELGQILDAKFNEELDKLEN